MAVLPYLLLALGSLASGASLSVQIPSSPQLPDPHTLPPTTHATLVGGPGQVHRTPLRRDNTFAFGGLEAGSYLLDIRTRDYSFHSLRVDVSETGAGAGAGADADAAAAANTDPDTEASTEASTEAAADVVAAWISAPANTWARPAHKLAGSGAAAHLSVSLSPLHRRDFYDRRSGFDLLAYLKSPMILMGLASAALIFGMPYLMENMDEETKAEFAEMQKSSPLTGSDGAASQIQNFDLAGWMAGKGGDKGAAQSQGGNAARLR